MGDRGAGLLSKLELARNRWVLWALCAVVAAAAGWATQASYPGIRVAAFAVIGLCALAGSAVLVFTRHRSPAVVADERRRSIAAFVGRQAELREMLERHDYERSLRAPRTTRLLAGRGRIFASPGPVPAVGPVLLFIHGMPGVGKSELAQRLADALKRQYPDGIFYANLGAAGQPRFVRNVLESFLKKLGFDPAGEDISTTYMAKVFRTLTTSRRILFILDAARDVYQVQQLLPSSASCAVIVTSRQDLSLAFSAQSFHLQVPEVYEALDMLRAFSRTSDSVRPECAVKVVELCGRLPLAIRSVGERVVLDGADLCNVAELLRAPRTRLDWLSYAGRAVRDRVESDIKRLSPGGLRALRNLTLVRSASFAPWVLGPLLEISAADAGNAAVALCSAGLLQESGTDHLTGTARYSFHPLVRLAAAELWEKERPEVRAQIQEQLDGSYVELLDVLMARIDRKYEGASEQERGRLPSGYALRDEVAEAPTSWIQAEYASLIKAVSQCYEEEKFGLCWRVAALLGDCVDSECDASEVIEAFAEAQKAADHEPRDPFALINVRLSLGTYLAAVERYDEAHAVFGQVTGACAELRLSARDIGVVRDAARREAVAWRKLGESYLQMAAFRQATSMLEQASAVAEVAADPEEMRLIRLLQAESNRVDSSSPSYGAVLDQSTDDQARYRAHLGLAESERRRGNQTAAINQLRRAAAAAEGNARKQANVHYRLARLYLTSPESARPYLLAERPKGQARQQLGISQDELRSRMIRHAAQAVVIFYDIHDHSGVVRARTLLSRCQLAAGHLIEADNLISTAQRDLDKRVGRADPAYTQLHARVKLARSELFLTLGRFQEARQLLDEATTLFAENDDWSEQRYAISLLRTAQNGSARSGQELRPVPAESPEPAAAPAAAPVPARLTDTEVQRIAAALRSEVGAQLRQALVPDAPVSFVGVMSMRLAHTQKIKDGTDAPMLEIPVGVNCDLTVTIATGQSYYAGKWQSPPSKPDLTLWREVSVKSGKHANMVDLEVAIDAPFIQLSSARGKDKIATENGTMRHSASLRALKPGTYDLRVALFSAGRLVQALPVELCVVANIG